MQDMGKYLGVDMVAVKETATIAGRAAAMVAFKACYYRYATTTEVINQAVTLIDQAIDSMDALTTAYLLPHAADVYARSTARVEALKELNRLLPRFVDGPEETLPPAAIDEAQD